MIIKYGGNAMKSPELRRAVAAEIAALRGEHLPVVVHGGGPFIERELAARGLSSTFKDGLRVTPPELMDVVEMALCALNKRLSQEVGQAVGLMGRDSDLLRAETFDPALGRVGRVTGVNAGLLRTLLGAGLTPVLGCVAVGPDGEALNVNADTAAGAVAGALGQGIIFLTDVDGVYRDYPDPASRAAQLSRAEAEAGIAAGWIAGGMIPKVRAALDALERGAPFATIASGMTAGVLAAAARGEAGTRLTP
ncbi:acetylglutamate kinase [Deinococcus radiopugnans]|uniref:Acetylglutamate kinase n=1 Tax=Deinococcus radiopugnans ATCC 19172 TaxID=585398 RepID=A0A5C4Y7Y2_9DEIO|nr:acetylglutamate kinase [Deinococcus radiopugnans]MBB6017737.1 acetylglutamate kinase [Deinococcus radiopugnans ATCC 19172]TNM71458.1 acetylglutamate kinase [Deinococcus radiopugnans ATCC 19172]